MSLKTFFLGNNNYGFIKKDNVVVNKTLVNNQMKFIITSDYDSCAKNHCAATLLTNLCIYYKNKGYKRFIEDNDKLFKDVHDTVGDGPVAFLVGKIKRYFSKYNYSANIYKLKNLNEIKNSIDNNNPCAMLLMDALFNWHWVLVVGYKDEYLQIIDNWHRDTNRFYKINVGSKFISSFSISIK